MPVPFSQSELERVAAAPDPSLALAALLEEALRGRSEPDSYDTRGGGASFLVKIAGRVYSVGVLEIDDEGGCERCGGSGTLLDMDGSDPEPCNVCGGSGRDGGTPELLRS